MVQRDSFPAASIHPQGVLPLGFDDGSSFEAFYSGAQNMLASTSLAALASGQLDEQQLYCWGGTGVGKSHLLAAVCQATSARGYRIAYLTGDLASQPRALEGLENCELVCLDDLQQITPDAEVALFHCINRCRDAGTRLVIAANCSPDRLDFRLPDLITRLSWGPVFQLVALQGDELVAALEEDIERRRLVTGDGVIEYLLRRYPRDMASLKQILDTLDDAAMRAQRRLTIPLVKSVLPETLRE